MIRPIALAVPRRGPDILVFEGHDPAKNETSGCRLADPALYERDVVGEVLDDAGTRVLWRPLSSFTPEAPLYPAGLSALLVGSGVG